MYRIKARYVEGGVICATSPDIQGFVVEATGMEQLIDEACIVGCELLRGNHRLSEEELAQVEFEVTFERPEPERQPAIKATCQLPAMAVG